jgi:ATP-dependent 26S proteasome regulatory subunit
MNAPKKTRPLTLCLLLTIGMIQSEENLHQKTQPTNHVIPALITEPRELKCKSAYIDVSQLSLIKNLTLRDKATLFVNRYFTPHWNHLTKYFRANDADLLSFNDIIGLDEVKKEFSTILKYIENPELYNLAEIASQTSWILTGWRRTGKQFSFECLCGEIAAIQQRKGKPPYTFININLCDLFNLGKEHIEHIDYMLDCTKCDTPTIILINDIELLGLCREFNVECTTNLLTAINNITQKDPSKVIIVIAVTDNASALTTIFEQNGRSSKTIYYEWPTAELRKEFLTKEFIKMKLDPNNFDIDAIVEQTNGYPYDSLQELIYNQILKTSIPETKNVPDIICIPSSCPAVNLNHHISNSIRTSIDNHTKIVWLQ